MQDTPPPPYPHGQPHDSAELDLDFAQLYQEFLQQFNGLEKKIKSDRYRPYMSGLNPDNYSKQIITSLAEELVRQMSALLITYERLAQKAQEMLGEDTVQRLQKEALMKADYPIEFSNVIDSVEKQHDAKIVAYLLSREAFQEAYYANLEMASVMLLGLLMPGIYTVPLLMTSMTAGIIFGSVVAGVFGGIPLVLSLGYLVCKAYGALKANSLHSEKQRAIDEQVKLFHSFSQDNAKISLFNSCKAMHSDEFNELKAVATMQATAMA